MSLADDIRVFIFFLCVVSSQTGIPGISKFLEILDYWNLRDVLRPHVKKLVNKICGHVMRDVEEMEQMTEPRIIKSHLPLYLLNPKLLDTSKVKTISMKPLLLLFFFLSSLFIHYVQLAIMNLVVIGVVSFLLGELFDFLIYP